MKKIQGPVAAAYSPMHEDFTLAPELIDAMTDYCVDRGLAGLFAVGSTGEFCSLTMAERKLVAERYVKAAAGRIPVIINVGSCCGADAVDLARHAAAIGADAACGLAPFYFRPETERDLAEFLKPVAAAAGDLPFFLYHAPGITGVNLSMYRFLQIAADEIPNFAGMKFTNENLAEFQRCIDYSDRFQMFCGRDEMLLASLAVGGTAGVGTTYNYLPRLYTGIFDAFARNDFNTARKLQNLTHRASLVSARYGLASIKIFMRFAGIDVGPMRPPVNQLTAAQIDAFRRELDEAGLSPYIG